MVNLEKDPIRVRNSMLWSQYHRDTILCDLSYDPYAPLICVTEMVTSELGSGTHTTVELFGSLERYYVLDPDSIGMIQHVCDPEPDDIGPCQWCKADQLLTSTAGCGDMCAETAHSESCVLTLESQVFGGCQE